MYVMRGVRRLIYLARDLSMKRQHRAQSPINEITKNSKLKKKLMNKFLFATQSHITVDRGALKQYSDRSFLGIV